MMAQGNFGNAVFFGIAVQSPPSQSGTQAAGRAAFRYDALDDAVGVPFDDVVGNAERFQILGQDMLGKAGLLLVQVDGDQFEFDRRGFLQIQQNVEQGIGILAAGQTDHDLVAVFDHVVIGDGVADVMTQALLQFVELGSGLLFEFRHDQRNMKLLRV